MRRRSESGDVPRGLSHVSHSPNRTTLSPTWNTTIRLRSATASHPRRHVRPLTFSLNSSSATSWPSASSHRITLFGGYLGLLPPPTRKSKEDVWSGTTAESVPPVISVVNFNIQHSLWRSPPNECHTALPDELQGPCTVDGEAGWGSGSEDATLWIEASVEDENWGGGADGMPRKIHPAGGRGLEDRAARLRRVCGGVNATITVVQSRETCSKRAPFRQEASS